MKLEQAIEDGKEILDLSKPLQDKDYKPAIRLLIGAGEREEKRRRFTVPDKVDLLPGETTE